MKYSVSIIVACMILALGISQSAMAQTPRALIEVNELQLKRYSEQIDSLRQITDSLKLVDIMYRLEKMGWPGTEGELIKHTAMALAYDEEHEMAKWVAHIILRDVATGRTTRSNDFREDPNVSTGSAQETDYFLKTTGPDGKIVYDGFGFDRGHLAASADFRWNQKALSETYFYSNMSPQRPEFNRESWATVEDYIRSYAIENEVDIFVVTGPVLKDGLPKIERSRNSVSIPEQHYKVAYDPINQRAIGILMPNELCEGPSEAYVVPIDEIETLTGLDFFPNLAPAIAGPLEANVDYKPWLPSAQRNDAKMMDAKLLDKGQYNTLQAYTFMDTKKKVYICGTVVSTFKSANNNIFINLDKRFPNTVFTVNIWSRDIANFSYNPEVELEGKRICAKGEVTSRDGLPQMTVNGEKQILFLEQAEEF